MKQQGAKPFGRASVPLQHRVHHPQRCVLLQALQCVPPPVSRRKCDACHWHYQSGCTCMCTVRQQQALNACVQVHDCQGAPVWLVRCLSVLVLRSHSTLM